MEEKKKSIITEQQINYLEQKQLFKQKQIANKSPDTCKFYVAIVPPEQINNKKELVIWKKVQTFLNLKFQNLKKVQELNHENIIKYYSIKKEGEYLITYMPGVAYKFKAFKNDYYCYLKLICQLLSTLKYLHEQNIFHKDLKQNNFMVEKENDQHHLVIIDFSICTTNSSQVNDTQSGLVTQQKQQYQSGYHMDVLKIKNILDGFLNGYNQEYSCLTPQEPKEVENYKKLSQSTKFIFESIMKKLKYKDYANTFAKINSIIQNQKDQASYIEQKYLKKFYSTNLIPDEQVKKKIYNLLVTAFALRYEIYCSNQIETNIKQGIQDKNQYKIVMNQTIMNLKSSQKALIKKGIEDKIKPIFRYLKGKLSRSCLLSSIGRKFIQIYRKLILRMLTPLTEKSPNNRNQLQQQAKQLNQVIQRYQKKLQQDKKKSKN